MHAHRFPALLTLALALASTALHAGGADPPAAPAQATAPSGAPGPQHRALAELAGPWAVVQTLWSAPGRPPAVDRGSATIVPVLGGRHLRQDLRIDAPGAPFEGLGYLGYDNASGRYESSWMDTNFTGMIIARGDYDAATRTWTFIGAGPDPARPGATSPLREVTQLRDRDHFSYAYYERHDGKEMLAVRLEYARLR